MNVPLSSFDVKRRLSSLVWNGSSNNMLVGFQYTYDSMDNPQYERWLHDNGDYDYYEYNHRYELTGVTYRSPDSTAPPSFGTTFPYNDNLDRSQATFGGPFSAQPTNMDSYAINTSDEYIGLTRNDVAMTPGYDRAGNMTNVPVLPVTGITGEPDVNATNTWDAFNCLFSVNTGVTPVQNYRYDPFRRRIATLQGTTNAPIRRFIYDGWTTAEERLFTAGATPASAPSTLERIYVDGPQIDEHLLTAIDRSGTGILTAGNLNAAITNANQWYYFLPNRLGSVTALLSATNPAQTLEYYRYTAYGEATVLPSVSDNGYDLSVNFAAGWQRSSPEHGNCCFFTGQRWDDVTGLYDCRNRYYEPRSGRFLSRDPGGYSGQILQLYHYAVNSPEGDIDPLGLQVETPDPNPTPTQPPCAPDPVPVCGPDVSKQMAGLLRTVVEDYNRLSPPEKQVQCTGMGWWNVDPLRNKQATLIPTGCATLNCVGTVMVDGGCYHAGAVAYMIYGVIESLCSQRLVGEAAHGIYVIGKAAAGAANWLTGGGLSWLGGKLGLPPISGTSISVSTEETGMIRAGYHDAELGSFDPLFHSDENPPPADLKSCSKCPLSAKPCRWEYDWGLMSSKPSRY